MMPVENMERLQTSLSRVPYVFLPLSQDDKRAVVWLVGARKNADVLERAARSAYLNPLVLPDNYQGTPAEIIAQLRKEIQNAHQEIAELKQGISPPERSAPRTAPVAALGSTRASRMMTDAIVRYGKMRYTYLIVGWLVSSAIPEFTRKLKLISKGTVLEAIPTRRDGPNQEVPVSLGHRPILRPFQMLVTTYAQPRYDEVDPTLLMTITFPLLFGAMFGDIGHGLLLAGLGWLISSGKVKAMRSLARPGWAGTGLRPDVDDVWRALRQYFWTGGYPARRVDRPDGKHHDHPDHGHRFRGRAAQPGLFTGDFQRLSTARLGIYAGQSQRHRRIGPVLVAAGSGSRRIGPRP